MGEFKSFLETSTIHGLSYISSTRKYARFFWLSIVIAGFVGASLLIQESFASWSKSPISTTIETLPISEISFPKVTVCPPKNTYTDLNYDMTNIGNISIDFDLLNENSSSYRLLESFVKYFQNEDFKEKIPDILAFDEIGKFENWYNGKSLANLQSNKISTYATSGEITSPYFGEDFQSDKFNWAGVQYDIIVDHPFSEWDDYENEYEYPGTIILSIEYDILDNLECIHLKGYGLPSCLDGNGTREFRIDNFEGITIIYHRRQDLTATEIKELKLKHIPGF